MHSYTLSFRLTDNCNADCAYCSTFKKESNKISVKDFNRVLFKISQFYKEIVDDNFNAIDVHFSGGELLTLDIDYVSMLTKNVRAMLGKTFDSVTLSCSTNLIGHRDKIDKLMALFDGTIDTSIDSPSFPQRTVAGSVDKYKELFYKSFSDEVIRERTSLCYVVNKDSIKDIFDIYKFCKKNNTNLEIKIEYDGIERGELVHSEGVYSELLKLLKLWIKDGRSIMVEPFNLLYERVNKTGKHCGNCFFNSDCTKKNLFVAADGSIHLCWLGYDRKNKDTFIADSDFSVKDLLDYYSSEKVEFAHKDCVNCNAYEFCQGGCKADYTRSFNKSVHCDLWLKSMELIKGLS